MQDIISALQMLSGWGWDNHAFWDQIFSISSFRNTLKVLKNMEEPQSRMIKLKIRNLLEIIFN